MAPFTLSRGDVFRIEFRVDPAAWAGSPPPDTIFLQPGGGQADGAASGCLVLEVFDGSRRIGSNPEAICGPLLLRAPPAATNPAQTSIDFSSIVTGGIQGRIDLRLVASRFTSDTLYTMALARSDAARGDGFFTGIRGGITITGQSIVR